MHILFSSIFTYVTIIVTNSSYFSVNMNKKQLNKNFFTSQKLTIHQLITEKKEQNASKIAIVAPRQSPLTYNCLLSTIKNISFSLNSIGLGRSDRVAVVLPNGPEMAVAFLAISSTATCAPLNPNYRASEFEFYLQDLQAKALVLQSGATKAAREVAQKLNIPILELNCVNESETRIFTLSGGESKKVKTPGFASSEDVALVLHTSGTTSRPKIVPLTHANLCASAQNVRAALDLKQSDICLNVMPLFHIHGLIGALLSSLSAGASIVCTPGFEAPKFFDWWSEYQPTWYSAVPTMHQAILARANANRHIIAQNSPRLIRSSSAPLPPKIMTELESVFNAPVIESYGMTEASHQMASNPLPPKARKPGSVGIAAGPEIKIMDEAGNFLPSGQEGEVVIKGTSVTAGYQNNPTANENAFTNGWFRTGDLGYLDADNYLFLAGRIKEIINRGGEKISPREVDEVLLDHPAIDRVVTFAAPHTLLVEDVAAAVVLKENQAVTESEIKEFAAVKLSDFKVPRVILFLDEIPKGPTGKRQRIGLAQKLGLTASDPNALKAEYVEPRTSIEAKLVEIWSNILDVEQVGIYDNFFQLGGDSILAAQIVNRIREALQVELSFIIFFEQPTVANMAIKIAQIQAESLKSAEMSDLMAEIESLSDEEAQKLFNQI